MLNVKSTSGLIETLILGGFLISSSVSIYGLMTNKASVSFAGSIGICGTLYGWKKSNETEVENGRLAELLQTRNTLKNTLETVQTLQNEVSYTRTVESALRANYEQLGERYRETEKQCAESRAKIDALQPENSELKSKVASWKIEFDKMIQESERELLEKDGEIARLTNKTQELERELMGYQARSDSADELAKLRAESELKKLQEQIQSLSQEKARIDAEFVRTANAYNQVRETLLETNSHYESELGELKTVVTESLPSHFDTVLSERDRELMRLAGMVQNLSQPRKFESVGEYTRADKLIDLLYQSEHQIVLDALEIVPNDERGNFKAFYWVRGNVGGQTTIDALNELTDSLAEQLFCIQPIRFDFDLQNPHRIGATFVYRKVKQTKDSVSKLWKSADQFVTIAGKWSRVRITGGSESGKSPLAEMIAGSMQRVKPTVQIRLAFPKDGSDKNHWSIPVTYSGWKGCLDAAIDARKLMNARDNGNDSSKYFYAPIIDESDTALDKYSDLATEIKALIKSGSHNNVGIVLCGQNANVRQWKGFDRSDFENVVNVHIGTNSYHAIENSNLSDTEKKRVKDSADKLTSYCEGVNESIEDEDLKTRFALVLEPNKKPYFLELPRFGSIYFDNFKASKIDESSVRVETDSTLSRCQHLNSIVRKTYKDSEGNAIKQNRKCKECGDSFTVHL